MLDYLICQGQTLIKENTIAWHPGVSQNGKVQLFAGGVCSGAVVCAELDLSCVAHPWSKTLIYW